MDRTLSLILIMRIIHTRWYAARINLIFGFWPAVHESMMIEPTENESKETLDDFAEVMFEIAKICEENPQALHDAPVTTPVSRLDEVKAVKNMDFSLKEQA